MEMNFYNIDVLLYNYMYKHLFVTYIYIYGMSAVGPIYK